MPFCWYKMLPERCWCVFEENVKKSNSDSSNTTSNNIDRYLIPIVAVNLYFSNGGSLYFYMVLYDGWSVFSVGQNMTLES